MPIGDDINDPIPPVGTAGTSYASQLVAFLTEVKSRLETKIALSSLLMGTLDFANNAIQNLAYVSLYEGVAEPEAPDGSLHNYQGNLYWVGDSTAPAVRITNGSSLDASGIGGITGDYGSGPEEFKFVGADQEYYAYDDEGTSTWAKLWVRNLDLAGTNTGSSRVRLGFAGGSSYDLTLPPSLPSVTYLVQMDSTGQLVADSNLVYQDVTLNSNKNITLQGTGYIQHGAYTQTFLAAQICVPGGAGVTIGNGPQPSVQVTAGNQVSFHLAPMLLGRRLTKIKFTGTGSGGSTTPTRTISRYNSDGTLNSGLYTYSSSLLGAVTTAFEYTLTLDSPVVLGEGAVQLLSVTPAGGTTTFYTVTAIYDTP